MRESILGSKVKAMDSSTKLLTQWLADESGVTAIEYALLATLIAVAMIGAVSATGASLTDMYDEWTAAVIDALRSN